LEVGGERLIGYDGDADEECESASGEPLGEVTLIRIAHRRVG
jgi:hypothetical protein